MCTQTCPASKVGGHPLLLARSLPAGVNWGSAALWLAAAQGRLRESCAFAGYSLPGARQQICILGLQTCGLLLRQSDGAEGCCKVSWGKLPARLCPACRSNAADFAGGRGADAPVVQLDDAAAGEKLRVSTASG